MSHSLCSTTRERQQHHCAGNYLGLSPGARTRVSIPGIELGWVGCQPAALPPSRWLVRREAEELVSRFPHPSGRLSNSIPPKSQTRVSATFRSSMAPKRGRAEDSTASPPPPPLRTPKRLPVVVFAHGAGAPSSSDWMIHWKEMVRDALDAVEVVTFDYPYMSGGKRRAPPKAEKLVDHHLGVVKDAVSKHQGHPLVLMGKSMGSRVSCMVATSEDIDVSAVICLGYPLKGAKGVVRDETLLQMKVPTMFVQGSKDALCPLDKLESTRKKMTCKDTLHVIDGGDHSLKVGKKHQESTGINQQDAEMEAVKAIAHFVQNSSN